MRRDAWQFRKSRRSYLASNPVCEHCNRAPSEQVHHIKPIRLGGDPIAWANLMAVCHSCHKLLHKSGRFTW